MTDRTIILWLRQDLRLADNGALAAAIGAGADIVPLYILDEAGHGAWPPGAAARWWLHHSLAALSRELTKRGTRLLLMRGKTADVLAALAEETRADVVHCTRCYEPAAVALEAAVKSRLEQLGVALKRFGGNLLAEPEALRTKAGEPYRVYTPYWRALSQSIRVPPPWAPPERIPAPAKWPKSDRLEDWALLPARPDWAGGLREAWRPGEEGARARLAAFLDDGLDGYGQMRNRPDRPRTSRLSPHLHWGEIAPGACWRAVELARDAGAVPAADAETFLKELVWREFSYHLLFHWPSLPEVAFRPEFSRFPWAAAGPRREAHLAAWRRGRTGYPIVDAGMRELWATGWMHNRVRMVVASFLIKDLLIPWQEGEAWFWDTLVDADLASNAASWQWVAGSGADAAPYFRIFNPVSQGEKFDPDGAYVRRWVPELARLPASVIHAPWRADEATLASAGVILGRSYPLPIVDHASAREAALAAFAGLKG